MTKKENSILSGFKAAYKDYKTQLLFTVAFGVIAGAALQALALPKCSGLEAPVVQTQEEIKE